MRHLCIKIVQMFYYYSVPPILICIYFTWFIIINIIDNIHNYSISRCNNRFIVAIKIFALI